MNKLIYLSIIIGAISISCQKNKQENTEQHQNPISVSIANVNLSSQHNLILSGKIEAGNSSVISTRVMGYVEKIMVDVGDHVKKGQLLIEINSSDINAKRAQVDASMKELQAALNNAEKDVERYKYLHAQKSATDKEYEQVLLQYESLQSKYDAALQSKKEIESMYQYTSIRAPYDGDITYKAVHEGDIANPGMPLLMMEQKGEMVVVSMIPEKNRVNIQEGSMAMVYIPSIDLSFETQVQKIGESSVNSGGQYLSKLTVPSSLSGKVLSGMYVTIKFKDVSAEKSSIYIPSKSVIRKDQLAGVYVYTSGKAYLRWLKTGEETDSTVEVLSGLQAKDTIVLYSEEILFNGATVVKK